MHRIVKDIDIIDKSMVNIGSTNVRARSVRLEHRSDGVSALTEPDATNLLFTFHHTSTGWHTMGIVFDFLCTLQVIRLYK